MFDPKNNYLVVYNSTGAKDSDCADFLAKMQELCGNPTKPRVYMLRHQPRQRGTCLFFLQCIGFI